MIQSDIASSQAWWFLIPSVPIGIYYAYKSTFGYYKKMAFWRNALGTVALTIFFSLAIVKSFQGYLYIYNCSFGTQKDFTLKGFINYIDKPRRTERLFSIYRLEVTIDSTRKKIKLDTKTKIYEAGQRIDIEMKQGSLGYLYIAK